MKSEINMITLQLFHFHFRFFDTYQTPQCKNKIAFLQYSVESDVSHVTLGSADLLYLKYVFFLSKKCSWKVLLKSNSALYMK
jgi:hypothetical protein